MTLKKKSEIVQDGAWLVRLFIHVKRNVSAYDLRRRGYNIEFKKTMEPCIVYLETRQANVLPHQKREDLRVAFESLYT